jgi:hypothetical protein
LNALNALLETVSTQSLTLSPQLIKNIPPHPIGFQRSRELIRSRTDLAFDPMAYAESAADMTFGLLLHPSRATRLIQHNALDASQPSLESVVDKIIAQTFKSIPKNGYDAQLQMITNHALLNNLIRLVMNDNASAQARAIASLKIDQLEVWLNARLKTTSNESWKAHYSFELSAINSFRDDATEYKAENLRDAPPGQPIGLSDEFCGW